MTFLQAIAVASLALALGGCAHVGATRGCFVGVSFFPPSPVLLCGLDVDLPKEKGE